MRRPGFISFQRRVGEMTDNTRICRCRNDEGRRRVMRLPEKSFFASIQQFVRRRSHEMVRPVAEMREKDLMQQDMRIMFLMFCCGGKTAGIPDSFDVDIGKRQRGKYHVIERQ